MKKILRNGFSLMEMMIVLLIVAIIAAATAPMVTKKMARSTGGGDIFWEDAEGNVVAQTDNFHGLQIRAAAANSDATITFVDHRNNPLGSLSFGNGTVKLTSGGNDVFSYGPTENGNWTTFNNNVQIGQQLTVRGIAALGTRSDDFDGDSGVVLHPANDNQGYTFGINAQGQVTFSNGVSNEVSSDIRLKNVGEKFEAGLNELKQLDLFHYTYKDDIKKTPHVGVIAQDLQKVFPDAVTEGEDGYLRIRMEDMFYAMVNSVKELDTRFNLMIAQVKMYFEKVDTLEATVEAQKQEIEALKEQNARFEERLAKLEKRRFK